MSDHHSTSPDKNTKSNPLQMAIMVVVGAAGLILGIFMLAHFAVGTHDLGSSVDSANTPAAVAARIAPVVSLAVGEATSPSTTAAPATPATNVAKVSAPVVAVAIPPAAPAKPAASASGESVFKAGCTVCHGAGIAGAPKAGDKSAWAPRVAKGKPTLYEHALKGYNAMPAKGGNPSLADADVKAAVDYMVGLIK